MDVIQDNMLFNGESAICLMRSSNDIIKQLFCPWKLVKASDTSPAEAFKTSSIEALHKVIDKKMMAYFLH